MNDEHLTLPRHAKTDDLQLFNQSNSSESAVDESPETEEKLTENCESPEANLTKLRNLITPRLREETNDDKQLLDLMPVSIRDYARSICAVRGQSALFVLNAMFGAISCAVANKFTGSRLGFSRKHIALFAVNVGAPGTSKNIISDAVTEPLVKYANDHQEEYQRQMEVWRFEDELYEERRKHQKRQMTKDGPSAQGMEELQKIIASKPVPPRNPRPWGRDATAEAWQDAAEANGGFYGLIDPEGSQSLRGMLITRKEGSDPKSTIITGQDCEQFSAMRCGRGRVFIEKLITPIMLATQPENLSQLASATGSGLTARMLIAISTEPYRPPSCETPCEHARRRYNEVLRKLMDYELQPGATDKHFPLDDDANYLLYKLDEMIAQKICKEGGSSPEGLRYWRDKSGQHTMRIATVLRVMQWAEGDDYGFVSESDIEAAWVFISEIEKNIESMYDQSERSQMDKDANRIEEWLATPSHQEQIMKKRYNDGLGRNLWIKRGDMTAGDNYWRKMGAGNERKARLEEAFNLLVDRGTLSVHDSDGPRFYVMS